MDSTFSSARLMMRLRMSEGYNYDDVLDVWWVIPDALAGMSVPFIHPGRWDAPGAGLAEYHDELPALWKAGIRAIVCLLHMPGAESTYSSAGFAVRHLPMVDGTAPTLEQFGNFLTFFREQSEIGHPVAVHCEAGVGRTGTLLAGFLIVSGLSAEAAIERVRSLRRGAVETRWQVQFLHDLAGAVKAGRIS